MRRVFFNGRFMSRAMTGVERYGWEMLRAIDALCSDGHHTTSGLNFEVIRPQGAVPQHTFTNIRETVVGRYTGHLWEQFELPRYSKDGVLVNFCNLAPLAGKRNVTCIHDANVYLMPGNFSWRFRTAYRILLPLVIRRSQRWITVSNYSADRLAHFRVSDRAPDAIVGDGCEHILRADPNASSLAKANLPRPFVFAMGSHSPNKNIDLILSLASALRAQGVSIVLAGGENAAVFKAFNSVKQPLALALGHIDDNDIAYLYSRALCFVFPSHYEGFGIPAVEAMACGCPVISTDTSVMPEILGDAALYCSPTQATAWLASILKLDGNNELRAELIERGRKRAALYSWRQSALKLLELIGAEAGQAPL